MATRNPLRSGEENGFDVGDAKVQHFGLLMKKPFGHKSVRWQKRFFIVKDSFLLYYNDSESKLFEHSHHFNIHPKVDGKVNARLNLPQEWLTVIRNGEGHTEGVIPLSGCQVEQTTSGHMKFALRVTNPHFRGEIWVGTEGEEECVEWKKAIKEAGTVTWKNAQLGERTILKMEDKSKEMIEEINKTTQRLNEEASALEEEKEKKLELESLSAKLESEKKAIEEAANDLRKEKNTTHQELQQTIESMKRIEEERNNLTQKTANLEANLLNVSEEKNKTEAELQERARLAQQLVVEKQQLEEKTSNLKEDLLTLEQKQRLIEEENEATAARLLTQELTAKQLVEEKKLISDAAIHLQADLEEVSKEKVLTETKLKEEKNMRIKTERRLKLAEDSLKRLDKALRDSGVNVDLQLETDVRNLKDFFEDCIKEEQYEAEKLDIFRLALHAKTNYNVETKKFEVGSSCTFPQEPMPICKNEVEDGNVPQEPMPICKNEVEDGNAKFEGHVPCTNSSTNGHSSIIVE